MTGRIILEKNIDSTHGKFEILPIFISTDTETKKIMYLF